MGQLFLFLIVFIYEIVLFTKHVLIVHFFSLDDPEQSGETNQTACHKQGKINPYDYQDDGFYPRNPLAP
jgi:hypothetical protein